MWAKVLSLAPRYVSCPFVESREQIDRFAVGGTAYRL